MKNKRVIYILLPLTLVIWGMIIYKVFFYVNNSSDEHVPAFQDKSNKKTTAIKKDSFELLLNYPDPFLKNEKRTYAGFGTDQQNTAPARETTPKQEIPAEVNIADWPSIKYEGIVKHIKHKHELAIVNINEKSMFMKPGDEIDNIRLIKTYNDSIVVCYLKQYRTIKKR